MGKVKSIKLGKLMLCTAALFVFLIINVILVSHFFSSAQTVSIKDKNILQINDKSSSNDIPGVVRYENQIAEYSSKHVYSNFYTRFYSDSIELFPLEQQQNYINHLLILFDKLLTSSGITHFLVGKFILQLLFNEQNINKKCNILESNDILMNSIGFFRDENPKFLESLSTGSIEVPFNTELIVKRTTDKDFIPYELVDIKTGFWIGLVFFDRISSLQEFPTYISYVDKNDELKSRKDEFIYFHWPTKIRLCQTCLYYRPPEISLEDDITYSVMVIPSEFVLPTQLCTYMLPSAKVKCPSQPRLFATVSYGCPISSSILPSDCSISLKSGNSKSDSECEDLLPYFTFTNPLLKFPFMITNSKTTTNSDSFDLRDTLGNDNSNGEGSDFQEEKIPIRVGRNFRKHPGIIEESGKFYLLSKLSNEVTTILDESGNNDNKEAKDSNKLIVRIGKNKIRQTHVYM